MCVQLTYYKVRDKKRLVPIKFSAGGAKFFLTPPGIRDGPHVSRVFTSQRAHVVLIRTTKLIDEKKKVTECKRYRKGNY